MYTALLDQNCIEDFYISIRYPTGTPYKLYEDDQATIKKGLVNRITPKARPLDALITSLHRICLQKTYYMVDTRSNMQLADLNYKLHGRKILRYLIYRTIKLVHPKTSNLSTCALI